MRKITCLAALLLVMVQISFSQNGHSRITISNPNEATLNILAQEGIDLRCGAKHEHNNLTIDISDTDKSILQQFGIVYTTQIEDLQTFYNQRAVNTMPSAITALRLEDAKTRASRSNTLEKSSVSSTVLDNYLQYSELDEKDWAKPLEWELGSMGGCYTINEVLSELDDMRAYSQSNSLDIVSVKQDASPTGQTTWGNPSSTITNNGLTYSGQGSGPNARWNPQTIYYIRITGNESTTAEGTKPQMLFTSMIHSREVNALMGNMYFMWYLIENYDIDPAIKNLVDNNELYFVPVVNPDGLRWNQHLSPSGGGMQRKNCRPNTGSTSSTTSTRGVDLNRNFDYFWGSAGSGSSGTPSNDSYRGPSAASEPETQIMVDFILARNFKTAIWNHTFANSIPHPYGGNPSFVSGREDEMHEMHAEMTKYNRYVSGATIFTPANGIADDWMLGGSADSNGSTGSGQNILATTPEHGGTGFWPSTGDIMPIAKRSVRISLAGAYHGGKYAKLHDLTQSDISSLSSNLDFGIERIGQTSSGFTVTVTPISANITNIVSPPTQTGMSVLEQRNVSASLTLDPSIQPNDKIEYNVTLSNDDGVFYNINVEKYYQPTVLLDSDPQNGFADWNSSGWNRPAAGGYTGSRVFRTGNTVPYADNTTKIMTTVNGYNLSGSDEVLIQFYSKWDLERNFDFVEFQASTNGTTWVNLNGKYTKPESSSSTNDHNAKGASDEAFQGNNASGHVYDGDRMDKWVMEEIVVDASNNASIFGASNVFFRFRMRSDSENEFENYSANGEGFFIDDFKIISLQIPCETNVPTGLVANNLSASSADLSWDNIPSATYDIRYREIGTTTWTEVIDLGATTYTITGLDLLTDYEVQVRSRCTSATSAYSASLNFTTTDLVYCNSTATNTGGQLSIRNVIFNTINNTNSSVDVYSDFTNLSTTVSKNTTYSISITPRYVSAGTNNPVGYAVWIDYNRNGDFTDSGELVFSQSPITGGNTVSGNVNIPSNIVSGNTRMRVSMKFNDIPDPCESFSFGEVEDYTINLFNGLLFSSNTWTPSAPTAGTNTENIMILDGVYNPSIDINVNSVTVVSGAEININKANSITVNGNIESDGEFIMNSDSNEFSSLMLSGSVTGDLKYNRHVNSVANGNDLIAPPFSGEAFTDFISNNSNVYSNVAQTLYLFGPFEKPTNDYLLFANNEVANLDAGKGYRVASSDNGTFTFTGAANTGNIDVSIEKTGSNFDKWNLIGNPYPTYIRLADFLTENISELDPFSVAVYGYDADDSNGSNWTIWNLAYSDANPNTLIAPGQGFFVSSKDGGANIAFRPSMRTVGSSDDFIAGRNNTIGHSILKMTSSQNTFETEIYFNGNTTLGLDQGYDAEHFGGAPSDFSIYSELVQDNVGLDMAIQCISNDDVVNSPTIPLGLNVAQGEQVVISIENTNVNHDIYLEDSETNTFTLLNTSDYTFTPNTQLSGTGRFYLRFGQSVLSIDDSELDKLQIYNDAELEQIVIRGMINEDTKLTLFDIQGREILRDNLSLNSTINTVNTSRFTKGVYLVQLDNGINRITKKLILR